MQEQIAIVRQITKAIVKIAFGIQDRFYLNSLTDLEHWGIPEDFPEALWTVDPSVEFIDELEQSIVKQISMREFIRLCFLATGIEIEFSGKGISEKGVIIDIDEEVLAQLDLVQDQIKFGQTVVQVEPTNYSVTPMESMASGEYDLSSELKWYPTSEISDVLNSMIMEDLFSLRNK